MSAARDLAAAAGFALGFLALLGVAETWARRGKVRPEWTRKLVHVAGGLGCLMLPFLVESHWVVLGLALFLSGIFWGSHQSGRLRSLHGVERTSRGVEYYPLVVYALFLLARERPWLYVSSLLALAISDAAAGLVGGRYGRLRYEVDGESKSVEGSLACLVATFLVVWLPLVLWREPSLPEPASCVLAALLCAALVTGFEAVSLGGRDNLWVPLGTYFVLSKVLRQPLGTLVVQNLSLAVVAALIALAAAWTRVFNVGGAILFVLWAYASWSLGSFDWALPVFTGFAAFLVLRRLTREARRAKVRTVLHSLFPSIVLLFAANLSLSTRWSELYPYLYGPFLAAGVLVVTQISWNRILDRWHPEGPRRPLGAVATALACWVAVALPAWFFQEGVPPRAAAALLLVALACGFAHDRLLGKTPLPVSDHPFRLSAHLGVTSAAALAALALQWQGLSPVWNPG